jgi:hypothetical protein
VGAMPRDLFVKSFTTQPLGVRVFNTDTSSGAGEHWIVVCCRDDGKISYLDSFGRHPCFYPDVYACLTKNHAETDIVWNDETLQQLASSTCGDYCVLFGLLWSRRWTMPRIVREFTGIPSAHKRDHAVRRLVIETYGSLPPTTGGEGVDLVHVQGTRVLRSLDSLLVEKTLRYS